MLGRAVSTRWFFLEQPETDRLKNERKNDNNVTLNFCLFVWTNHRDMTLDSFNALPLQSRLKVFCGGTYIYTYVDIILDNS